MTPTRLTIEVPLLLQFTALPPGADVRVVVHVETVLSPSLMEEALPKPKRSGLLPERAALAALAGAAIRWVIHLLEHNSTLRGSVRHFVEYLLAK